MEQEKKNLELEQGVRPDFSNPELERFIERRKIGEGDYEKLSKLISIINSWNFFEKQHISEFHNFWTSNKEHSAKELEKMKKYSERPKNWQEFVDILISLEKDYGWTTLYDLQGILEEMC